MLELRVLGIIMGAFGGEAVVVAGCGVDDGAGEDGGSGDDVDVDSMEGSGSGEFGRGRGDC